MRRNVAVPALVLVIMAGLVLVYLYLQPTRSQSSTEGAEATSRADTTDETTLDDGMGWMSGMSTAEDVPNLPPVKAFYEGEEVFFVHPEASDQKVADMLTDMMGSPVFVVPELARVPEEALSEVYVFTNGVEGDGPFGFQADVFDSAPGDEGYSPLRSLHLVTWEDESRARELRTLREVLEAEENGEVTIERQDVVINEPFLTWPGGRR